MISKIEGMLDAKNGVGGLVLRSTLGVVFLLHGYGAMFIYTPAGLAQFFGAVGIPFPLLSAWLLALVHLAGGTMLLLGLFTRINALVHAFVMGVATIQVHLAQGFFLKGIILDAANGSAIAGGYEYTLVLTLASLGLVFIGGGAWALDSRFGFGHVNPNQQGSLSSPVTQR